MLIKKLKSKKKESKWKCEPWSGWNCHIHHPSPPRHTWLIGMRSKCVKAVFCWQTSLLLLFPNIFSSSFSWVGHAAEAGQCIALPGLWFRYGPTLQHVPSMGTAGTGGSEHALLSGYMPRHSMALVIILHTGQCMGFRHKIIVMGEVVMGESRSAVEKVMPQQECQMWGQSDWSEHHT